MESASAETMSVGSLFDRVVYNLRFELLFTFCAIAFYIITNTIRTRMDKQRSVEKQKLKESEGAPKEQRSATQRQKASRTASDSNLSKIIRRGSSPEEVIRSYEKMATHDRWADLQNLKDGELSELFLEVFSAAVRIGRAYKLPQYFADMRKLGVADFREHLESVAKMCTAKKLFNEALAAFDAASAGSKDCPEICTAATWSCLLFCAVESEQFHRCQEFFKAVQDLREPSCEDFMNMLRYIVHSKSQSLLGPLLAQVRDSKSPPDNIAYNRALAVCVSADQLSMAEELLEEMKKHENVCDVITFNTLIKGYAQTGNIERCFELQKDMQERGIASSEVTFGILLDACIQADRMDIATQVFKDFQSSGCKLNAVLYTTLLKGLARSGQLDQAMTVFEQMCASEVVPDLVSFSVLIKVHCDVGKVEVALKLLDQLVALGLAPDEIVFNNLLLGCAERKSSQLGCRIFEDMRKQGVQPSHVTLSIMIKIFVKCKEYDSALQMLSTCEQSLGLPREGRLFVQLAQACVRDRQGKRVLDVVDALVKMCPVDVASNGRIIQQCISFNMLDTGADIFQLFLNLRSQVDQSDANALLAAAVKKKRSQIAKNVLGLMDRHGYTVQSNLRTSTSSL
jgi:pentatricopeptide repeat protein